MLGLPHVQVELAGHSKEVEQEWGQVPHLQA